MFARYAIAVVALVLAVPTMDAQVLASSTMTFDQVMGQSSPRHVSFYTGESWSTTTPEGGFIGVWNGTFYKNCWCVPGNATTVYGAIAGYTGPNASFGLGPNPAGSASFKLINGGGATFSYEVRYWFLDPNGWVQSGTTVYTMAPSSTILVTLPAGVYNFSVSTTVETYYRSGWAFFIDDVTWSFTSPRQRGDTVPTPPGVAPLRPGTASDLRVVADTGAPLDSGCRYRSGGPLRIDVPVQRVVGLVDGSGTLLDPYPLIANKYLSSKARVSIMAFDVDADEIDEVYLNDRFVGRLRGSNDAWVENVFFVPVEWVRFGRNANGINVPGLNTVRVEIDIANQADEPWCTSADWVKIEFDAVAPIFLVHGTNAAPETWEDEIVPFLESTGIPFTNDIALEPNGSIALNGLKLAQRLRELAGAFGARQCHIVTHSKGGNDSREYLVRYHPSYKDVIDVRSLFTLSTPFHGTIIADIIWLGRTNPNRNSTDTVIAGLLARDLAGLNTPCCAALHDNQTAQMALYNQRNPFPAGPKFYNFAADADVDNDGRISTAERLPFAADLQFGWANSLLDRSFELMYHAIGTIRSVELRYRIIRDSTGYPVARLPMIEVRDRHTTFEENDLVISVSSSQHPAATYVGQIDANHSTLKSADVMRGILSRIRADFPVREPK